MARLTYDQTKGVFVRSIGYAKDAKSQSKFLLGRSERDATVKNARLEQLWAGVKADPGYWTAETLAIAKAIARGDAKATVPAHPADDGLLYRLEGLRERFGNLIPITTDEPERQQATYAAYGKIRREAVAEAMKAVDEDLPDARQPDSSTPTLAELLAQFRQRLERKGGGSAWTATKAGQVKTLERLFPTLVIRTRDDLETAADTLASARTLSVKGKSLSPVTRRKLWERLHEVLDWAEDNRDTPKPKGWGRIKLKVKGKQEALVLPVWTVDQLRTIWQVASPLVRPMVALGLNCAYQEADFGDLEIGHIFQDKAPPVPGIAHERGDWWIVMERGKTGTPGLHKLWPETVAALKLLLERRAKIVARTGTVTPLVFIAETGRPLTAPTEGGNKSYRVANLWKNCLRAAKKVDPNFPDLTGKWLRKASQEYLRPIAGDELTSIHARRGQVTKDSLMKLYASRPWGRVVEATEKLRERFAEVFAD